MVVVFASVAFAPRSLPDAANVKAVTASKAINNAGHKTFFRFLVMTLSLMKGKSSREAQLQLPIGRIDRFRIVNRKGITGLEPRLSDASFV